MALLFLVGVLLLLVQARRVSTTIEAAHQELLEAGVQRTQEGLDDFFLPVELSLRLARDRGAAGMFQRVDPRSFNNMFLPVLMRNASVSSLLIGDTNGNEHMLLRMGGGEFQGRRTTIQGNAPMVERSAWEFDGRTLVPVRTWQDEERYDPRDRPWFQGGLSVPEDVVHWTRPYRFHTTKQLGITASMHWQDPDGTGFVVAYDVLLKDLTKFLSELRPSPQGRAFLLTDRDLLLGLTGEVSPTRDPDITDLPEPGTAAAGLPQGVLDAKERWQLSVDKEGSFALKVDGNACLARIVPYVLGDQTVYIGMVVPESDVFKSFRRVRNVLLMGGFILFLFALLIAYVHRSNRRATRMLEKQNRVLRERTEALDESLRYAKYLQDATLPTTELLNRWLSECFVLHLPKEAVGGDLYWMEPGKERILFAVGDATGHGIPGALVGMACITALDRSVRELGYVRPAEILDTVRQFVSEAFFRNSDAMSDGMDCCVCSLSYLPMDHPVGPGDPIAELHYAGANRPLLLLRADGDEVEVFRTDRISVGYDGGTTPFTERSLMLKEGDTLYLLTDGFTDQFGGAKDRKYGMQALRELLVRIRRSPMDQQAREVRDAFEAWKGGTEQLDDACMMAVRVSALGRLISGR